MTPDTRVAFRAFLLQCGEGCKDYGYLDQSEPEPVVTTAIGCALFTYGVFAALPWQNPDGSPATEGQKSLAWKSINLRPDLAKKGGAAFAGLTTIRLPQTAVDVLVDSRINVFEAEVRMSFPTYDGALPKAQEGLLRLYWATGGAEFPKRWPRFSAAWNLSRWAICAKECRIPKLVGEPTANELEAQLFDDCAAVTAAGSG